MPTVIQGLERRFVLRRDTALKGAWSIKNTIKPFYKRNRLFYQYRFVP